MPHLLLEIGCEELPATGFPACLQGLGASVERRLSEAGLAPSEIRLAATPRRLIVGAWGIPERQADRTERKRGPKAAAAWESEGKPSRALEGFCRSQGVDPASVVEEDGYVWVDLSIAGRSSVEVLAEILPQCIAETPFAKSMRWAGRSERFARPVRWIVASLDGAVVDFEWAGIASGRQSRGMRHNGAPLLEAGSWDELMASLRAEGIEPDPAARAALVREQVLAAGGKGVMADEALIDENTHLTEAPGAHRGGFDPDFLRLPESVLITAMAKHERFFPIRGEDGRLRPEFVSVRNGGDPERVRHGNEWVLNNRFNDAAFFFDEDSRRTLEDFRADLAGMAYQKGLGTMLQKSERMEAVARAGAAQAGADPDRAALAARLAKADLSTGLVGELASLQGRIGEEYALREGHPEPVCRAVGAHYSVEACEALQGEARTLAHLTLMADVLDKLVGYLGLGLAPKGSADPFALRQAATLFIRSSWARPWGHIEADVFVDASLAAYAAQGIALDSEQCRSLLEQLLRARFDQLVEAEPGQPAPDHDARQSVLAGSGLMELTKPNQVRRRVWTASRAQQDAALVTALRRPVSILASAEEKGLAGDPQGPRPASPMSAAVDQAMSVLAAETPPTPEQALAALQRLEQPINEFFEGSMVMAEDADERQRNLNLMAAARAAILLIANPRLLKAEDA
jgi:glycyl-tRNA synthetase beta chain